MRVYKYIRNRTRLVSGKSNPEELQVLNDLQNIITPKADELYIKGSLAGRDRLAVAVVGSRRITSYGRKVCDYIVGGLAAAGVTIVSGLMYGVDLRAHKAALNAGGRTIAVLGYGVDVLDQYAYARNVVEDILSNDSGAIMSEYPPKYPSDIWTFPRRNRIVAGLAKCVIIIEAAINSGSIITAGLALEQSKEVFVIPGSIFSGVSQGKHKLLKDGAVLIDSAEDVLEYLGIQKVDANSRVEVDTSSLNDVEVKIFEVLRNEGCPVSTDFVAERTGLTVSQVSVSITSMELKNFLDRASDNRIAITSRVTRI